MKCLSFCCLTKVQLIIDVPMHFSRYFCAKPNLRWILDAPKFRMPFFPGQSLLLSTTVLNDNSCTKAF